jgi:cob(I)alamin adenosyltransferase
MKVYTKTGDEGTTSLYSGERKSKSDPIFHVLGHLNAINAWVGLALTCITSEDLFLYLSHIQNSLFDLGAHVADTKNREKTAFSEDKITNLEKEIDRMTAYLPPLRTFILPGGSKGSAYLHQCAVSCRECERYAVNVVDKVTLAYINRLSDYFFTAARYNNFVDNVEDVKWGSKPRMLKKENHFFEMAYFLFIFVCTLIYLKM